MCGFFINIYIMKYLKIFEDFEDKVLIIVDVQKSFKKYFNDIYLEELKKYASEFTEVYQIYDNHIFDKPGTDFMFSNNPVKPIFDELYNFNEVDIVEKRYHNEHHLVYYKPYLSNEVYRTIVEKQKNNLLKVGDMFDTKHGTKIIFVNHKHMWFHITKKMMNLFSKLKGRKIVLVGGAIDHCLKDIEISMETFGLDISIQHKFIYSGTYCFF